jgi:hypothetical protein
MKYSLSVFFILFLNIVLCSAQDALIPKVFDISNKFVFGRYANGEWKAPSKYNGKYKVYRREMLIGTATIKSIPNKAEEPCAADFSYAEKFENTEKIDYIAVEGTWNHLPRIPKKVNAKDPTHIKVVGEWAKTKNLVLGTFEVTEAFQVDIDNDNTSETIIVARNIDHTFGAIENNFSVVLVYKGGQILEVCSFSLDKEAAKHCSDESPCYAAIYRFVLCLDINGDGILEIITADEVHEGMGKTIFQWKDNKFQKILDWGCGV